MEAERFVLYGNRESGHSYKVKLALCLLGIDHEYRPIDLGLPRERRPADFRAVSMFGEVPVLLAGGKPLVQSDAILLHLAERTGRLGGDDPDMLRQWLFWEANRIGFSIPNLRFARSFAPGTPDEVVSWLETRAVADLDRLDRELADRPFLLGGGVTVADIACCGYLFWPEQAGLDLTVWQHVTAWLDRIRGLPGWGHPYDLMG